MVVDTSALIAILADEAERSVFIDVITNAATRRMSVATLVETSIVIETRYGAAGLRDLDLFIERAAIELVPVDVEQARMAGRAFSQFGEGRHPAGLNYGDCFSYALARAVSEPLLYKGADFAKTDIPGAVAPSVNDRSG